jgi:hypothetical protein
MKRLLALPAFFVASQAFAYSLSRTDSHHIIKWYDSAMRIELQVDGDGPTRLRASDGAADVRAAIDRAIDSWNSISCNALDLVITSTTTTEFDNVVTGDAVAADGINRVGWIEQAAGYPYGEFVLGVTSPVYYQDGTIIEADIIMNGVDDNWAVYANVADIPGGSTNGQAVDVESVVVHELGHLIGLGHVLNGASMSEPPTMTPTVDPQLRTRTLEANDRNGACFLYPSDNNTGHSCSNDAQCPEFIDRVPEEEIVDRSRCVSGVCSKIEDVPCGDGDLGERCCTDNCKGQLICLALAEDQTAYCASRCDPSRSSACPDGFTCAPTTGDSGVCLTDVALGCDCDTNDDCTSSCACDSDCNNPPPPSDEVDDDNCAAGGHLELWSLLAILGVLLSRRHRYWQVPQ